MKIKRFHGNITILTLFVLLASALMWILVALYMKNFIRYSDEITSYEKTNYLAKAWTELGLAIVWSREVWLDYRIESWDYIKWNFECPFPVDEWEECPVDPKFSLEIKWLGTRYNDCTESNTITIQPWLSAIIPLFRDRWVEWWIRNALSKQSYTNRGYLWEDNIIRKIWSNNSSDRRFGIVWTTKDERNNSILEWVEPWTWDINAIWSKDPWDIDHAYLIAANPSTETSKEICVWWANIPQETVKIISIWYYNNRQLWTETLATKALPTFLQWDNYIH